MNPESRIWIWGIPVFVIIVVAVSLGAEIISSNEPTETPSPAISLTPTESTETLIAGVMPIDTPIPKKTPTLNPSTSTPTPTPLPDTPTPIPPTDTPIPPTLTPTPIPPTDKPEQSIIPLRLADAVVDAPGGAIRLHDGPGENYGLITTLQDGNELGVLRRVYHNEDWLKVVINPDSDERIEGYVNLSSGLIKVNVKLENIPLIYEYGPALYEPPQFESRALEDIITFRWQDYGELEEHQYYSIILVRDDLPDEAACYHWQSKIPEVTFKPEDYQCTPGVYYWGVGIATDLSEGIGDERKWRDDSERDARNKIGLNVPVPDKPNNSGGSSNSGNGGSGGSDDGGGGGGGD